MKIGKFEKYQAQAPETMQLPPNYWRDHGETAVYWLSAAGVLVNSRGTNIMIDPVLSIASDDPAVSEIGELLLTAPPILASQVERLDAVLYTHADNDHLAPMTARELQKSDAEYHGTPCVDRDLAELGIAGGRRFTHTAGETFNIGGLEITATPAFHPHQLENIDFKSYFTPEDCCGYRIATPDGVIWIPGDTILQSEHLQMKDVDLLFIDFGDDPWHFGLDGAIGLANVLEQADMIMFHFATFYAPDKPYQNADPRSVEGRLRRPERLHVLAPGEKYVLRKR